jgi:DNA-binding PadR family transcriptional regulator
MRSSLELLLLSFVQEGLCTAYELKAKAGISLGSTIPALARLEKDGLLRASAPAARNSRSFQITPAGLKALAKDWRNLSSSASDPDGAVRIVYLAWKHGSPSEAVKVLRTASSDAVGATKVWKAESELFGIAGASAHAGGYRWLRKRLEGARLRATAEELAKLANEIGDTKKKMRVRKKGTSKRLK